MNIADKIVTKTGKKMEFIKLEITQDVNKAVSVVISTKITDNNNSTTQEIAQPLTQTQANQLLTGQFTIAQARAWFLQQNGITEI